MRRVKVIVEKHPEGYVAHPLGLKGIVVGEGDSYEEALADAALAIRFHIEIFGAEVLDVDPPCSTRLWPRPQSSAHEQAQNLQETADSGVGFCATSLVRAPHRAQYGRRA